MTIDFKSIKAEKKLKPPRILLYGTPKVGKSSWAASIPDNLFFDMEDGTEALKVSRVGPENFPDHGSFMSALKDVYEQDHDYKALTVDTIDHLESLIFAQAAEEHGKKSIADVGYGAGYATAQNIWKETLSAFDMIREKRNMMIILISHDQVKRYDDPLSGSYDRYSVGLNERTSALVKSWADCIAFVNNEVFVKSEDAGFKQKVSRAVGGDRVMHLVESPAYLAGNRFGMKSEIPFTWSAFQAELTEAMGRDGNNFS